MGCITPVGSSDKLSLETNTLSAFKQKNVLGINYFDVQTNYALVFGQFVCQRGFLDDLPSQKAHFIP